MNVDKIFELLKNSPSPGSTDLDSQIQYMKVMSEIIVSPLHIAIFNSLKELKGIKQNQLNENTKKKEKANS